MLLVENDVLEEFPYSWSQPDSPEFVAGFKRMAAFLCAVLGWKGLPRQVAEDLSIDISVKLVVTHPEKYQHHDDATFRSYLFRVAINRANDWWRQHKDDPEQFKSDVPDCQLCQEDGPPTKQQLLIRAAYATLSAEDQRILEIRAIHSLSYEEVAEVLGITAGAARVRFQRSKERLRDAYLMLEAVEIARDNRA